MALLAYVGRQSQSERLVYISRMVPLSIAKFHTDIHVDLVYSHTRLQSPATSGRHLPKCEKKPKMIYPTTFSLILVALHFGWLKQLVSFLFPEVITKFSVFSNFQCTRNQLRSGDSNPSIPVRIACFSNTYTMVLKQIVWQKTI